MILQTPLSPLSTNANVEKVREYDPTQLAKEWADTYQINITDELEGIELITKYRCLESGMFFYLPVACEGSGFLYDQLSKYPWYYTQDKWEHQFALTFCRPGMRVLEIGCGGGEFLTKAARQGCECVGLEINPGVHASNGAREVEIREQFLSECAAGEEGSFDIVCAFQVLEHISSPKEFLQDCIKAAKKNGVIIFGTPNSESFLKHSHNLLDLPPHHMGGWGKSAYEYLENILPVKLLSIRYESLAPYHYDYFIETYRSHFSKTNDWKKYFFSGTGAGIFKKFLSLGGWRLIRGQCMIAVYQKL